MGTIDMAIWDATAKIEGKPLFPLLADRYGSMRADRDWLQFDCALSYGLVEYLRTLEMLREHGW